MPAFNLRSPAVALAFALMTIVAPAHASHDWMASPPLLAIDGANLKFVPDATPAQTGMYRVPDSDLLVTGYSKIGLASAFGPLGILIAASANDEKAKKGIPGVSELPVLHLSDEARALSEGVLSSAVAAAKLGSSGARTLTVSPVAMLSPVGDDRFVPYVLLQVELKDGDKTLWATRYTACTGGGRPLVGTGAWREAEGQAFRDSVHASLQAGLRTLLADLSHARETPLRAISVKTRLPFQQNRFTINGTLLSVEPDYVAVLSDASDGGAFAGVHLIDRHVPDLGLPAQLMASARRVETPGIQATRGAKPPTDVYHLSAADLAGHTWRYPHPRDPEKYGDVTLTFSGDRVTASNARSSTSGRYQVADDMVCLNFESSSWGAFCFYRLDRSAAPPQLLFVGSGKVSALRIDDAGP